MHITLKCLPFYKLILLFGFSTLVTTLPTTDLQAETSSARVVNGYIVDITEVPYQASLRRKLILGWAHTCGAVIIDQKALLTAAHCVTSYVFDSSSIGVVVGTSSRVNGGQLYDISRVIMHDGYSDSTLRNDIAMLVTVSTITFSGSVNAVAFAPSNIQLPPGTTALVSGYGATSFEGAPSSLLLAAQVNIVEQRDCVRAYLGIATIISGMICASAQNPPRDACQGDSGGPLVANGHLIGIVSFGEGCAASPFPGVYTRISQYESWIIKTLKSI